MSTEDCKCAEIQRADPQRHFQGCPQRKEPLEQHVKIGLYARHPSKAPRVETLRDQVLAFHEKFGHAIGKRPAVPSMETLRFRLKLIGEEFCEAVEAVYGPGFLEGTVRHWIAQMLKREPLAGYEPHLPDLIDALGDLDYVVEGTRLVCGVDGGPIAQEIQRANMAKDAVGDLKKPVKPADWTPPDIEGELIKQGWKREKS